MEIYQVVGFGGIGGTVGDPGGLLGTLEDFGGLLGTLEDLWVPSGLTLRDQLSPILLGVSGAGQPTPVLKTHVFGLLKKLIR